MSDAFVLGAGFSKAIDAVMPSTDELGAALLASLRASHSAGRERHSSDCDGLSCDQPLLPAGASQDLKFEGWLTALAERQPFLQEAENDRRHALYTELTRAVADEIDAAVDRVSARAAPEWLHRLVRLWHDVQADVVTFNYDTLVEAALETALIPNPRAPSQPLSHRDVGPTVIPWWERGGAGARRRPADTFTLTKLHGSTDWYWDETSRAADSIVQVGLRRMWRESRPRYDDAELRHRAPGKVAMIVPPTTAKAGYFDNPVIRHLWRSAYTSLRTATRVFVIGYSLPAADSLVRTMLADCLRSAEVWVIDPDRQVGRRFGELAVGSLDLRFCGQGPVDMVNVVRTYEAGLRASGR